jgi:hypothetical protein
VVSNRRKELIFDLEILKDFPKKASAVIQMTKVTFRTDKIAFVGIILITALQGLIPYKETPPPILHKNCFTF